MRKTVSRIMFALLLAGAACAVTGCATDNSASVSYPEYNHWWR